MNRGEMMPDSFLLIQCSVEDLPVIRHSVHTIYTQMGIKASEVVYSEGRDLQNPYLDPQVYRDRLSALSRIVRADMGTARQITKDREEHRQVLGVQCGRCGHAAVTLCFHSNHMLGFLRRLGWKIHVYQSGQEAALVCRACAGGGDEPLSVFSLYYRLVLNKPRWRTGL